MHPGKIEIAPFDKLLVFKKGYTPEFVSEIIAKKKLGGLRIFSILQEDRLDTIDFLKDYDFLKGLDITSTRDFDFSFLHKLTKLKKLSIDLEGNNVIDLSALKNLEELSLHWRKNITGLEHCTRISALYLTDFKETDLIKIQALRNLLKLSVKTGALTSLKGIEHFSSLQYLQVANCRKLSSVADLNGSLRLSSLEIDGSPKISDYADLVNLPALKKLTLADCKDIPSIQFIENFPALSQLSLSGNTGVADGDLRPALRIKDVQHQHRDRYNVKIVNPAFESNIRKNLQKITDFFRGKK